MAHAPNIFVAFLQGINVGGKNKVNMADLKACFEDLDFENVQTYLNSGNVIFSAASTDPRKLELVIEKSLAKTFSSSINVLVRNFDDIKKVVTSLPQSWKNDKTRKYDIIFLSGEIDNPKIVKQIEPQPDLEELHYLPGVLLWSIAIKDFSKSNLIKFAGTEFRREMTVRGPNTVRKIYELMTKLTKQ